MKKGVFLILVFLLLSLFFVGAGGPICLTPVSMPTADRAYPTTQSVNLGIFYGVIKVNASKDNGEGTPLTLLYPKYKPEYKANLILGNGSAYNFNFPPCNIIEGWTTPSQFHVGDGCRTTSAAQITLVSIINAQNIQGISYTPYRPPESPTKHVQVCFYPTSLDRDLDGYNSTDYGGNDCNDNNKNIYPGAPELCDNKDNNCDGDIDEGLDCPVMTYYFIDKELSPIESSHKMDSSWNERWHFIKFTAGQNDNSIARITLILKRDSSFSSWSKLLLYIYSDNNGKPNNELYRVGAVDINNIPLFYANLTFGSDRKKLNLRVIPERDYWLAYQLFNFDGNGYIYQAIKISQDASQFKHSRSNSGPFMGIAELPLFMIEGFGEQVTPSCTSDDDCSSMCYVGICDTSCSQIPVVSGQSDDYCESPNYCDGSGNCCYDDDLDSYHTCADIKGIDCDDTNINIYPRNLNTYCDCDIAQNSKIIEDCDDTYEIDEDCDGAANCDDTDCYYTEACKKECNTVINPLECRSYSAYCYWSYAGTCVSCSPAPLCFSFGTQDDCELSCNMNCVWDGNDCNLPSCASNIDFDGYCDDVDNCKTIASINQEDCDGDGIGDECDPSCSTNEGCNVDSCPTCTDSIEDDDEECDSYDVDETKTCSELQGTICSSGLDCVGGAFVISKDSGKCCKYGSCGTVTVLLTGQTQYRVEESECRNPDEEGIGKKVIYKYDQAGALLEQTEEDCAILPSQTVPFYSLISILITVLVLISFYVFRRKIFSYFNK